MVFQRIKFQLKQQFIHLPKTHRVCLLTIEFSINFLHYLITEKRWFCWMLSGCLSQVHRITLTNVQNFHHHLKN